MTKSLLVTRPNHDDAVNYLYIWSQIVIDKAKKKKYLVCDLAKKEANKKNFYKALDNKPQLIFINGHGSSHIVTGHDNQQLVNAFEIDSRLSETIFYARSCMAGDRLGPSLIKHGVFAFIGYSQDYIMVSSEDSSKDPLNDKLASLFLQPSNSIMISLINGKTVKTADQKSKNAMRKNIRLLLKSRLRDRQQIAAFLWHDIKYQVLLGNDQSKVSSR